MAPGTARCHAQVVTDASGWPMANVMQGGAPMGYGPSDLQSAYNVVQSVNPSSVPNGPVIAIVDAFGYPDAEPDLATYRAQFRLPPCSTANGCFTKVNQTGVPGNYPHADTDWDQEQALDVDMVSAICPSCRILLVEADSASLADLAASENTAASLAPHAISNSYGGGEPDSPPFESAYNHPGIAVTASSGDAAYAGGPQFPASSPHVTAVGGTSLVRASNSRGWAETVWPAAGSGCSTIYPKPVWQLDPLCALRMVADVSAVADPNTGVAVFSPVGGSSSAWLVFGGTSVGAPLTAAIYGLQDDRRTFVGNLYPGPGSTPGPYKTSPDLNLITSGSNGTCGEVYLCTASPGWNYNGPTGLGTPNGATAF
jgi:subtilase family serine protease